MKKTILITTLLLLNAPLAMANSYDATIKSLTLGHSAILCGNGSHINKDYVKVLEHFSQSSTTIKIKELERVSDTYNNQAICVILERIETR